MDFTFNIYILKQCCDKFVRVRMNVFKLEQYREDLIIELAESTSISKNVNCIYNFFEFALKESAKIPIESFILEFIEEYASFLSSFQVFGSPPEYSEKLIIQIDQLLELNFNLPPRSKLVIEKERLSAEIDQLYKVLSDDFSEVYFDKSSFPVLEAGITNRTGFLETITVHLKPSVVRDFIIIPSSQSIEERLKKQVEDSWELAKNYCSQFVNIGSDEHHIIIQFDRRVGEYTGNSLGVAICVSFIEAIQDYYNSPMMIKNAEFSTYTGSIDRDGIVHPVSEKIIQQKTNIVFFSHVKSFALPKEDLPFAERQIQRNLERYPSRSIKLVPVENLDSLLIRRDLIEIQKQGWLKRSTKLVKKNKSIFAALVLIPFLLHFFSIIAVDDNPWVVRFDQNTASIVNKNGDVLWTKKMKVEFSNALSRSTYNKFRIISDVDSDGKNEVILCYEDLNNTEYQDEDGRIACFDKEGNLIWRYIFKDKIETNKDKITNNFLIHLGNLVETLDKRLILIAAHAPLYPSAIFQLNLLNGERLEGTLWNPGHIDGETFIDDLDDDGKLEFFTSGINNAYNSVVFFALEIDNIRGITPATEPYKFKGFDIGNFDYYIIFPKTDYAKAYNYRYNKVFLNDGFYNSREKLVIIRTMEEIYEQNLIMGINYFFKPLISEIEIEPDDTFSMKRDSLVKARILQPPLTDTKEYREILMNQIRFWNGQSFVSNDQLNSN